MQYGHGTEVPRSKEILQIYLSRYFYLILMIWQISLLTNLFFFKVILCHVRNLYVKGCFIKYFLSMLPNLLIYLRYLGTWGDEIIEGDFLKKAKKTAYHSSFLWTSNMIRLMVLMAVILSHPQRQEFQFSLWKIILPPRFHRTILLKYGFRKKLLLRKSIL